MIPTSRCTRRSLGASWQLDLFGRVRRLTEAAQAQVYASEQAQRGVVLSLVTSVATSYIVLRTLDRQLEIAQATASNFGETARIFDLRFKAGIVAKTEVMQITSQHQQALAAIPAFEQAIAAQENLISILLGPQPGAHPARQDHRRAGCATDPRRPALGDAAAPARHHAGRTEPRGRECQHRRDARALLSEPLAHGCVRLGEHRAWATSSRARRTPGRLAASLTGPIFTFGGIKGQVRTAEAREREALLFYQQTILNAFRETNDALIGSQKKIEEVALQSERVDALREFARLSRLRFDKGVAGYLEVLVAENELFAAELASVGLLAARYYAAHQCLPGHGWGLGRHCRFHRAQARGHRDGTGAVASAAIFIPHD